MLGEGDRGKRVNEGRDVINSHGILVMNVRKRSETRICV